MAQLLSNLPIGAKVKFGRHSINGEAAQSIIWLVVAKNHSSTPSYPTNSVTLLTEKSIDYRAYDAKEPSNTDSQRAANGNNRYSQSNIDQWLNKDSAAGAWYVAQHSADQAPDASNIVSGAPYSTRPGFLNAFTLEEKNAIQSTMIRVLVPSYYGGGYEDISRKVFLASTTEVGIESQNDTDEGAKWEYFNSASRTVGSTSQAYENSLATPKASSASSPLFWWLRTPNVGEYTPGAVNTTGEVSWILACASNRGVRPALNLSSSALVSDTTDSDGCYTVIPNSAPSSPTAFTLPTNIYGGKSNLISWSSAADVDGDTINYQLECSIDGEPSILLYYGTSTNYSHLVPYGTTSVTYRVKAIDTYGESSAYTTSATKTVVNNNAPVISGTDTNLGVKSSGFTGTYTITDANNNPVTVTEAIDGVQIRSLVATLGMAITYGVTETTWLALSNGSHTLTISATDGIDTTVRTYTFTKLVDKFTIQNAVPWVTSTMPTRIMLVITRNIPSGAKFKVEVCNNGLQGSPTWEDCTDAVTSGLVHVFTNKANSAVSWGVCVRVTVERNGTAGACYVSAIGGNFE